MSSEQIPADASGAREAAAFRWATLAVAMLTLASLAGFIAERGTGALDTLALASFAVWFTKLTIFATDLSEKLGADAQWFNPWRLAYISWLLDLIAAVVLARIERFDRIPLAGAALQRANDRARSVLREFPGIRRLAFWGVFAYVFVPFPGSGALTGALISRLIGQTRTATLVAVGAGAGIAVVLYAALAVLLGSQWRTLLESPWLGVASVVTIALLAWFGWVRVKRELARG